MDGNGALFGTLSGNTREVLHKFTVDLPKKHGKRYDQCVDIIRVVLQYCAQVVGKKSIWLT